MPENTHTVHSYEYPHPENPGLIESPGEGYFDWAGRRLFLPDGSPDPATPGAYRYQTRPDLCDLEAPDSEPSSPRYEPPHLRHQPGDTFEIGGRPYDPEDRGPYGTPGWRPDRRTGRHRRNELPDPIPPWEQQPDDHYPDAAPAPRPTPAPPTASDRPSPGPRRRRLWTDERPDEEPYRFSKLREDAWDRWLVDSEPLARAHETRSAAAERECGRAIATVIRLVKWIVAVIRSDATPAATEGEREDSASLRHLPENRQVRPTLPAYRPKPHPGTGSSYINSWEWHFDARYPAAGGALL